MLLPLHRFQATEGRLLQLDDRLLETYRQKALVKSIQSSTASICSFIEVVIVSEEEYVIDGSLV